MKTAVSIPDELFERAEKTAQKMGIPRSQLFARALEEFISSRNSELITEKLNAVYPKEGSSEKSDETSVDLLRRSLKDDAW